MGSLLLLVIQLVRQFDPQIGDQDQTDDHPEDRMDTDGCGQDCCDDSSDDKLEHGVFLDYRGCLEEVLLGLYILEGY